MPTGSDQRFAAIERRLDALEADMRRRMKAVENTTAETLSSMADDIESMRAEPVVPSDK